MSLFGVLFNRKKQDIVSEKNSPVLELWNEELLEDSSPELEPVPEVETESEEDPNIEYEIVEREILPAKIICPDCGGITLEGLDFCDKCGGELH